MLWRIELKFCLVGLFHKMNLNFCLVRFHHWNEPNWKWSQVMFSEKIKTKIIDVLEKTNQTIFQSQCSFHNNVRQEWWILITHSSCLTFDLLQLNKDSYLFCNYTLTNCQKVFKLIFRVSLLVKALVIYLLTNHPSTAA